MIKALAAAGLIAKVEKEKRNHAASSMAEPTRSMNTAMPQTYGTIVGMYWVQIPPTAPAAPAAPAAPGVAATPANPATPATSATPAVQQAVAAAAVPLTPLTPAAGAAAAVAEASASPMVVEELMHATTEVQRVGIVGRHFLRRRLCRSEQP